MGIGDAPLPVASAVEANNPVPETGDDKVRKLKDQVIVDERAGRTALAQKIAALTTRIDAMQGRFIVATTVPFTVKLDGSATAVAGRKHVGSSYVVGTQGRYIRDTGDPTPSVVQPLCIPDA